MRPRILKIAANAAAFAITLAAGDGGVVTAVEIVASDPFVTLTGVEWSGTYALDAYRSIIDQLEGTAVPMTIEETVTLVGGARAPEGLREVRQPLAPNGQVSTATLRAIAQAIQAEALRRAQIEDRPGGGRRFDLNIQEKLSQILKGTEPHRIAAPSGAAVPTTKASDVPEAVLGQSLVPSDAEYDAYFKRLAAACLHDADCEDAVNISLFRRYRNLRDRIRVIRVAAKNCRINESRKRSSLLENEPEIREWIGRALLDSTCTCDAVEDKRRESLTRLIQELPPRERDVLTGRLLEGLSVAEIADTMRVTPNAVYTATSNGIKKLRVLASDFDSDFDSASATAREAVAQARRRKLREFIADEVRLAVIEHDMARAQARRGVVIAPEDDLAPNPNGSLGDGEIEVDDLGGLVPGINPFATAAVGRSSLDAVKPAAGAPIVASPRE